MKFLLLFENYKNKTIINIDIQSEYEKSIGFSLSEWVKFLNKANNDNIIVFLYNGKDTVGDISKDEYMWWLEDLGLKRTVIEQAIFYDKGYAFFRYCMDFGLEEDAIVDFVKFMIKHNINDSRDLDEEMWNTFMEETNYTRNDVRDLMEISDDCIYIPDLMNVLKKYNNIVITGGGITECLKEVEIALLALNKPYEIMEKFTY